MYIDLNPGVKNRPVITYAHQVYNLQGCIISIEKGVKPGNDTITEETGEETKFSALYIPRLGFKLRTRKQVSRSAQCTSKGLCNYLLGNGTPSIRKSQIAELSSNNDSMP